MMQLAEIIEGTARSMGIEVSIRIYTMNARSKKIS